MSLLFLGLYAIEMLLFMVILTYGIKILTATRSFGLIWAKMHLALLCAISLLVARRITSFFILKALNFELGLLDWTHHIVLPFMTTVGLFIYFRLYSQAQRQMFRLPKNIMRGLQGYSNRMFIRNFKVLMAANRSLSQKLKK